MEIATEGDFWVVYFLVDGDSQLFVCGPFLMGGDAERQLNVPVTSGYGCPPYSVVIRTTPVTTSSQIMVQMILYWFWSANDITR